MLHGLLHTLPAVLQAVQVPVVQAPVQAPDRSVPDRSAGMLPAAVLLPPELRLLPVLCSFAWVHLPAKAIIPSSISGSEGGGRDERKIIR